jgi:DNA invertase Pin-like site-specific DNA recombinase
VFNIFKKLKKNEYSWTFNYIKEYNEMIAYYEKELEVKNNTINNLQNEILELKKNMKWQGKKRQITDDMINKIKNFKNEGMSYSQIEKVTGWSKATISRVINNNKNLY